MVQRYTSPASDTLRKIGLDLRTSVVYTSLLRGSTPRPEAGASGHAHGEGQMSRNTAKLALLVCGLMAAMAPATASAQQGGCTPAGRDLQVTYQPVQHSADATAVQARLTLANDSSACALPAQGWKLYFNFVRQPLAAIP